MASITLVLNDAEQNALRQLLDISLRQAGLYALDVVSHFDARVNEAAQAAMTPAPVSRPAVPPQASASVQPVQTYAGAAPVQHEGIIEHVIDAISGHSSTVAHATAKTAAPAMSVHAAVTPAPSQPASAASASPAPSASASMQPKS